LELQYKDVDYAHCLTSHVHVADLALPWRPLELVLWSPTLKISYHPG